MRFMEWYSWSWYSCWQRKYTFCNISEISEYVNLQLCIIITNKGGAYGPYVPLYFFNLSTTLISPYMLLLAQTLTLPRVVTMVTMYVTVSCCMFAWTSCVNALVNHFTVFGTERADLKDFRPSVSAVVLPSAAVTPTSVPGWGFLKVRRFLKQVHDRWRSHDQTYHTSSCSVVLLNISCQVWLK